MAKMDSSQNSLPCPLSCPPTSSHSHIEDELYCTQFFGELTADIMNQECEPKMEGLLLQYLKQMKEHIVEQGLKINEECYEEYTQFVKTRIQESYAILQAYLNRHILMVPDGMVCPGDECHLKPSSESDTAVDDEISQTFKDILKAKQSLVHIESRLQELEQLAEFSRGAVKIVSESTVD